MSVQILPKRDNFVSVLHLLKHDIYDDLKIVVKVISVTRRNPATTQLFSCDVTKCYFIISQMHA